MKKISTPKISVLLPTYNGSHYLKDTLKSVLDQDYDNYELIISDDCSTDTTVKDIKNIKNPHLKLLTNQKNVGYPQNLNRCLKAATGDIIFLMGQDDILLTSNIFSDYVNIFVFHPSVGAITRPYYWFDTNTSIPVRRKIPLDLKHDTYLTLTSPDSSIVRLFDSLDQLSGLAMRKKYLSIRFHPDIFPAHIYPFASIFRQHPVVYSHRYNVAVRIASSQTRSVSSIYMKSPILSWKQMVDRIFPASQYSHLNHLLNQDFIARNYVGLVQIKNYGRFSWLIREIYYLIKFRWQNIFSPQFWFFAIGTIIVPSKLLIHMVDWYKQNIYRRLISRQINEISTI